MTARSSVSTLFSLLLVALPALAQQEAADPRPELEALETLLDRAVAQVSRPSVHAVLGGREAPRGYRLKGVGAMFVLPPRVLPGGEHERVVVIGPNGRNELYMRKRTGDMDVELRAMEVQVEVLQREAETAQQKAERSLERAERSVRVRAVAPPQPPPPAAPPSPESPLPADVPPADVFGPGTAAPPPWRFWFETGEEPDSRTPDRVIADVQNAVTAALESYGARLRAVPPDELVLVAVDFLPQRGFDFDPVAGRERSLVVKVKKRDLVDRSAGKISAEELRRRIEYAQY